MRTATPPPYGATSTQFGPELSRVSGFCHPCQYSRTTTEFRITPCGRVRRIYNARISVGHGGEGEPPTVYLESLTGALHLDKPNEIQRYENAWSALAARAQDERESFETITTIMKEMNRSA